jgi:VIT1/CCC1 family predicted Fe2+/Mn2+ transporter
MSLRTLLRHPGNRLDIVAGLIDGILNALTLAAAKLFTAGGLTLVLVGKLAAVTACTTGFVFFVAHYAQLRAELVHAERQLNLLSHGRLATTRLGKQILSEAAWGAVLASLFGVIGATIPLVIGLAIPQVPILGIALTVLLLGGLGWLLARSVFGSPLLWALTLMFGGIGVTTIGVQLDILG